MSTAVPREHLPIERASPIRIAMLVGCLAAAGIAVMTLFDSRHYRGGFPRWFLPTFAASLAALGLLNLYMAGDVWFRRRSPVRWLPARRAAMVWLAALLSIFCTSSLHAFHPFRPGGFAADTFILRYNFLLTASAAAAIVLLSLAYFQGRRIGAVIGLLVVCAVLLAPNDACLNEFNRPWLNRIGASPLMFLPNVTVLLLACSALIGEGWVMTVITMSIIALATLALGAGHMSGTIW